MRAGGWVVTVLQAVGTLGHWWSVGRPALRVVVSYISSHHDLVHEPQARVDVRVLKEQSGSTCEGRGTNTLPADCEGWTPGPTCF